MCLVRTLYLTEASLLQALRLPTVRNDDVRLLCDRVSRDFAAKLSLYIPDGMSIICHKRGLDASAEMVKLFLENSPNGIACLIDCPFKILKIIASANPQGVGWIRYTTPPNEPVDVSGYVALFPKFTLLHSW